MDFTNYFDYRDFFVSDTFPDIAREMWEQKRKCKPLKGALYQLNEQIITPLRESVGIPLRITSGYCNEKLGNALRRAGYPRSETSLHYYGMAADITTWHLHDRSKLMAMFAYIRDNLPYCELFLYKTENGYRNIHVSIAGWDKEQVAKIKGA